jgi:hypothetical protein
MKTQKCKFVSGDGIACLSPYHSKMFHGPRKPIKRKRVLPYYDVGPLPETSRKKSFRKRATSRAVLVRQLDSVFSQYIRLKDSKDGMATCVTCGSVAPWKQMQNGHFYSRGRIPTRWDEDNCHVQDYRCNVALKGDYINYTKYMIDRYGREFVDELEKKSKQTGKYVTPAEIREMIEKYTELVKSY